MPKKLREVLLTKLTKEEAEKIYYAVLFSSDDFLDAVKEVLIQRGDLNVEPKL